VLGYFSAKARMGWVVKEMEEDDPNRKSNSQVIDRVDALSTRLISIEYRARGLGVDAQPLTRR
jgi:hypothetical protein